MSILASEGPDAGGRRPRRRSVRPYAVAVLSLGAFAGIAGGGWHLLHSEGAGPSCPGPGRSGRPLNETAVVLRVLNGTSRSGLARETASVLATRGFHIASVGNASAPIRGRSQVRYPPGATAQARLVATQLPTAALVLDRKVKGHVDLVLGGRFADLRTPAQVAAAKKKAGIRTPRATASASCA